MAGKQFGSYSLTFVVVPGNTTLFALGSPYLPTQGDLVEYLDAETSVTTIYSVQDVIFEVQERAAVPADPPDPVIPMAHFLGVRVEIRVVP